MFNVATRAAILIVALSSCRSSNNLTAAKPPSYDISEVLETSYEIREEANKIRGEAFNLISRALTMKEEALELREETYSARSELERYLLETLALVKANAVSTAQNIAEIKDSLEGMSDRMEKLEEKEGSNTQNIAEIKDSLEKLEEKVGSNAQMTELIKKRQELWASEIRLISLYKMTDQTSISSAGQTSDHAVDGQFSFAKNVHDGMSVYTMTNNSPNNKLNIHLGGLFRIHRVKIWNIRFCCQERIVGTRVYADHRQIGVAIQTKSVYEFNVSTEDPTYAKVITLHQELGQHLHVLEVQVWGSGPFLEDDLFA